MPTPSVPSDLGYFPNFPDDAGSPVRYEDAYGLGNEVPVPTPEEELPAGFRVCRRDRTD